MDGIWWSACYSKVLFRIRDRGREEIKTSMEPQDAIDLGRDAIMIALLIGAPVLTVGMLVGLTIGLLQALTQVQDQTIAFVPKIIAMVLALGFFLPWLGRCLGQSLRTLRTGRFWRLPLVWIHQYPLMAGRWKGARDGWRWAQKGEGEQPVLS